MIDFVNRFLNTQTYCIEIFKKRNEYILKIATSPVQCYQRQALSWA